MFYYTVYDSDNHAQIQSIPGRGGDLALFWLGLGYYELWGRLFNMG